jgi:hypothetical protein
VDPIVQTIIGVIRGTHGGCDMLTLQRSNPESIGNLRVFND